MIKKKLEKIYKQHRLKMQSEEILESLKNGMNIQDINTQYGCNFTSLETLYECLDAKGEGIVINSFISLKSYVFWIKLKQRIYNEIVQKIAYPILLHVVCVVMISIYSNQIKYQISGLLEDSALSSASIESVSNLFTIILAIHCIVVGAISCCYFSHRAYPTLTLILINKLSRTYRLMGTIRIIDIYSNSTLFGISFHDTFSSLKTSNCEILKWYGYHILDNLEVGKSIQEIFSHDIFDKDLGRYYVFKQNVLKQKEGLDFYMRHATKKLTRCFRRVILTYKLLVYGFVILTVYGYYQVMLIPINLMEGL
ncbi:hypothetical protein MGH68_09610 [Erysipelothrix sp. D19-032]